MIVPDADRAMPQIVWALGLTQIVGYGTLYYSFATLAPSMAADFGWSAEWVFAVLSGSLLVSGLVAPISGRWADRFGAARVMSWGSVAAALSLVVCALAPERWSFVAGLVMIELASTTVLYATAFAALAQVAGRGAQVRITHLTLIAGFASTLFWPVTVWLHGLVGWREVYLIYAVANLGICLPTHMWVARATRRRRAGETTRPVSTDLALIAPGRRRAATIAMLAGFALLGFVSSAITVHMLPMLAALGLGGAGVVVTTLFGPAQVLSRLVNMQFGKGLSQPALAVLAACLLPLGLALLAGSAPAFAGAAAFALVFGLGSGLSSIVSGTLPLALFGAAGYGQRLGWISSARLVASALAPFVFSVLSGAASTGLAVWLVAGMGLAAAIAFCVVWWLAQAPVGRVAPAPPR